MVERTERTIQTDEHVGLIAAEEHVNSKMRGALLSLRSWTAHDAVGGAVEDIVQPMGILRHRVIVDPREQIGRVDIPPVELTRIYSCVASAGFTVSRILICVIAPWVGTPLV